MKKLRITLAVATIAVASFGAMSFTGTTKSADPGDLIWIDENGQQSAPLTEQEMQDLCGYPQTVHCRDGYNIDPETGEPTGDPVAETLKPF